MKTPVSTCLIFAGMMLMAHVIAVFIGMLLDSVSPYVEWDDEYSALRGNLNTFFNMAIMMVIAFVIAALGILLYEVIKLPITVYYIVLAMVLAAVMVRLIMTTPTKIAQNIDNM